MILGRLYVQMAMIENWSDMVVKAQASVGIDQQPIRDANQYIGMLYVLFIIIGSLTIVNLIVGVSINKVRGEAAAIMKGSGEAASVDDGWSSNRSVGDVDQYIAILYVLFIIIGSLTVVIVGVSSNRVRGEAATIIKGSGEAAIVN